MHYHAERSEVKHPYFGFLTAFGMTKKSVRNDNTPVRRTSVLGNIMTEGERLLAHLLTFALSKNAVRHHDFACGFISSLHCPFH